MSWRYKITDSDWSYRVDDFAWRYEVADSDWSYKVKEGNAAWILALGIWNKIGLWIGAEKWRSA